MTERIEAGVGHGMKRGDPGYRNGEIAHEPPGAPGCGFDHPVESGIIELFAQVSRALGQCVPWLRSTV